MRNLIPWDPTRVIYVKEDGTVVKTRLADVTYSTANFVHLHVKLHSMMLGATRHYKESLNQLGPPTYEEE